MGKKKETVYEYKDTSGFCELFPVPEYTRMQSARYMPFYCFSKNIKGTVSLAGHLATPDIICLIVCLGECTAEQIVENFDGNILLLCSNNFKKEHLVLYKQYLEEKDKLASRGFYDRKTDSILYDKIEAYKSSDTNESIETIERCLKTFEKNNYFCDFTAYSKITKPFIFSLDKLDWFAKKVFPYGVEAMGLDYKSVSKSYITKAAQFGCSGSENPKYGLPRPATNDKVVKRVWEYVRQRFDECGYFEITDLFEELKKPPYGLMSVSYSAYIMSYALTYGGLTEKQRTVIDYLNTGMSQRKIASLMGITKTTVFKHIHSAEDSVMHKRMVLFDRCGSFMFDGGTVGTMVAAYYNGIRRRRSANNTPVVYMRDETEQKIIDKLYELFRIKGWSMYDSVLKTINFLEDRTRKPVASVSGSLQELLMEDRLFDRSIRESYIEKLKNISREDIEKYLKEPQDEFLKDGYLYRYIAPAGSWTTRKNVWEFYRDRLERFCQDEGCNENLPSCNVVEGVESCGGKVFYMNRNGKAIPYSNCPFSVWYKDGYRCSCRDEDVERAKEAIGSYVFCLHGCTRSVAN